MEFYDTLQAVSYIKGLGCELLRELSSTLRTRLCQLGSNTQQRKGAACCYVWQHFLPSFFYSFFFNDVGNEPCRNNEGE